MTDGFMRIISNLYSYAWAFLLTHRAFLVARANRWGTRHDTQCIQGEGLY